MDHSWKSGSIILYYIMNYHKFRGVLELAQSGSQNWLLNFKKFSKKTVKQAVIKN